MYNQSLFVNFTLHSVAMIGKSMALKLLYYFNVFKCIINLSVLDK